MKIHPATASKAKEQEFRKLRDNETMQGDSDGRVSLRGERFNIMGAEYFMADIYEMLSGVYGEGAGGIIYNTGKTYGEDLLDIIENIEDPQKMTGRLLGLLKFLGYSDPRPELDSIIFPSSPTAEAHRNDENEQKKVCYFLAGMLTGAYQQAFGEEITFEETACRADGNDECVFELRHG